MQSFEAKLHQELYNRLLALGEIDEMLPEAVDIEAKWEQIGQSYIVDGVREFSKFPMASLGWIMYVGMAVAQYWDDDWQIYSNIEDLYLYMRDKSGFDLLDEYVRGIVLGLKEPEFDATEEIVLGCAQKAYDLLMHEHLEPGTEIAFRGYVACLHQLYMMGYSVQLKRLGYHMEKV